MFETEYQLAKSLNVIGWFIIYVRTYSSGETDLGARGSKVLPAD